MSEPEQQRREVVDRILAESLPKPGVAEAMRFWHYTRPVPTDRPGGSGLSSSDA